VTDAAASAGLPTHPVGIEWPAPGGSTPSTVGVIMRTRDRPVLLPRALQSVVGQTYPHWHLVVVNDGGDPGPVDAAVEATRPHATGVIEVVHLDRSGGMEHASNVALTRLDTTYFTVHDDDDTWLPTFLERTVGFLDDAANRRCGAVVCQSVRVWERIDGDRIQLLGEEDYTTDERYLDLHRLLGGNWHPPIAFLFRRALPDIVGPFNEALPVLGDWDFNLRVASVTEIAVLPEPLARYHLRPAAGPAAYGNTVVDGLDRHLQHNAAYRASLLRGALVADPSRLGLVVSLFHEVGELHQRLERIEQQNSRLLEELCAVRAETSRLNRVLTAISRPLRPFRRFRSS
jgi:hypothetical protein